MNITFWINNKRYKNIYCRLTSHYLRKEISTGLHINPKLWGGTYMLAKGNSPDSRRINQRLRFIKEKWDDIIFELEKKEDQRITPLLVKAIYEGKSQTIANAWPFLEALQKVVEMKTDMADNAEGSIGNFKYSKTDFEAFLKAEGLIDINTHAIDLSLTERYLAFLRSKGNGYGTIKTKFARLKTMVNIILKKNEFSYMKPPCNPFVDIHLKKNQKEANIIIENHEKWIDVETQSKIENTELNPRLDYFRKMFLFQLNTGLAQSDMFRFSLDIHITVDIHTNKKWIRLRRQKTMKANNYSEIPLTKNAKGLIDYFKSKQIGTTLINIVSYTTYRTALMDISKTLNIRHLTTHMARHTFGTRMLEAGVTMETVSKMLGHANIMETQRTYAKVTARKVSSELEKANII